MITIENNEYWFPCRHHNMSIATHNNNNVGKNKAKLETLSHFEYKIKLFDISIYQKINTELIILILFCILESSSC